MNFKKSGFTLAEMLITLAVIGIVAALTIPGLVKNHNEKAWATAQDVFTKKLEVAMKAMNTDGTLTGYSTTASFVNALKKNIKITKVCTDDVTKCFSKEIIWNEGEEPVEVTNTAVKYDDTQGQDWAETVGVQFANGVTALMSYNKNCYSDPYNNQFAASAACVGIIYDVSANKNPNANGKDIASNANVAQLGGNSNCLFEFSDGKCITKILGPQNGGYSGLPTADCKTAKDNGEIDVTYCDGSGAPDYWAGAVLACGGKKSNLPSQSQLKELAEYIYEGSSGTITDDLYSGTISMNTTNAAPFQAQSPYASGDFHVWSAVENSSYDVCYWEFRSSATGWYGGDDYFDYRSRDDKLAVCLGD